MGKNSFSQRPSSRRTTCELDLFFANENVNLKEKNNELAKNLAESKVAYAQAIAQRDLLQRDLFNECAKSNKLINYFRTIDMKSKSTLRTLFQITDDITQIIEATAVALNFAESSSKANLSANQQKVSVSSPNRTQAVKPMVDGHVIFRPMVKLTRVNQLTNLQQSISNSNVQNTSTEPTEEEMQNNETSTNSNEEISSSNLNELSLRPDEDSTNQENSSQSFIENLENVRLNTLRETDEDSSAITENNSTNPGSVNITGARNPILSGIFKEVRVYLSRDDNLSTFFNNNEASTKIKMPKISRMSSSSNLERSTSQEQVNRDETHNSNAVEPEVLNESAHVSSSSTNNLMDYDPLEGPSTLLNDIEKINTLKGLGLEPIRSFNTSTPNKTNESSNTSPRYVTLRRKVLSSKLQSSPLQRKYSSPRPNSFRPSSSSLNTRNSERRKSTESNSPVSSQHQNSPSPRKLSYNDKNDESKASPNKIKKLSKKLKISKGKTRNHNSKSSPKSLKKKKILSPDGFRKSPRALKIIQQKIQATVSNKLAVNDSVNIKEEILTPNKSLNKIVDESVADSAKARRSKRPIKCLAEPSLRKKLRRN